MLGSVALLLLFSHLVQADDRTFVIARAPQLSIAKTEKAWSPYIKYLTETCKVKFKLKLYNSRKHFENDIKLGKVDFYYGNPGYGIVGHINHGYRPIIRSDKKKLQGILVVREDASIKNIDDLKGKKLVFPGKTAFAASLLIKDHLDKSHHLTYKEDYVLGHDNVYRNVLNGNFDAGGGVYKTLNQEPDGIRKKLRVIHETPGVASHPLMVHPSVPDEVTDSVIKNTLALNQTEQGKKILKKIKLTQPVIPDYDKEYLPLEPFIKKVYSYLLINSSR